MGLFRVNAVRSGQKCKERTRSCQDQGPARQTAAPLLSRSIRSGAGYECGEGAPGQRLRQASPFRHDSEADSSSPRRAVARPALQSFERPGALGRRPAAPLRKNARFVETRCQSTFTRRCMRLRSLKSQPDCCSLPYALCPRQPARRFRTPSLVIDGRARRAG